MPETTSLHLRMKQALQWMKQNKQMLQKDIAAKMKITEVAFSNSMKRIQMKTDDDFVISFHQATGEIFSLEWLLNGEGEKFASKEKPKETQPSFGNIDFSSYINAVLAKSDEVIASLKRELEAKDEIIEAKDKIIAGLEKLAEERLHRIAELRGYIEANNIETSKYPFPQGIAEKRRTKNI